MKRFRPMIAGLLLTFFPLAGLAAAFQGLPRAVPSNPVLVVALPLSGDLAQRIDAAGGYPISIARPLIGILAHSQSADFLQRLSATGPLLLLDATRLSQFLCGIDA